jgi:Carboxypeptidase regulatory-like domain
MEGGLGKRRGVIGRRTAVVIVLALLVLLALLLRLRDDPEVADVVTDRTGVARESHEVVEPHGAEKKARPTGKAGMRAPSFDELDSVSWRGPPKTGALTGRVVHAADGTPCAGAAVVLAEDTGIVSLISILTTGSPSVAIQEAIRRGGRVATTDADGRFAFLDLPPAQYVVAANPLDGPSSPLGDVRVKARRESRVVIRTGAGLRLHGRVIHESTGEPVARAKISIRGSSAVVVTSGEDGRFVIPGFMPRATSILIHAKGYTTHEFETFEKDGDRIIGEYAVGLAGSIEGCVLDLEGHAVRGAVVSVSFEALDHCAESERPWTSPVRSGPGGGFTLTGLPMNRNFRIFARAEGYSLATSPRLIRFVSTRTETAPPVFEETETAGAGARVEDVVVVLRPAGRCVLEVVDDSGQPIIGAEIEAWERPIDRMVALFAPCETDAAGRVTIPELALGDHELKVTADGFLEARPTVTVEAGRSNKTRVTLSRGAALVGRVTWPEGSELGWTQMVRLCPVNEPRSQLAYTLDVDGDSGAFRFTGLDSSRDYGIVAADEEVGVSNPVTVSPGQSDVTLPLRPFGSIRGSVIDETGGSPGETFEIWLRPVGECARYEACSGFSDVLTPAKSGPDGAFEFPNIPAGIYSLDVDLPDGDERIEAPHEIRVESGRATKDVEIRLVHPRTIELKVTWDSGEPAVDLRVMAAMANPSWSSDVMHPNATGRHRLAVSGDGPILVLLKGGTPATTSIFAWRSVVLRPETKSLTVSAGSRDVGALCIWVKEASGRGIRDAEVTIRDGNGRLVPTGGEPAAIPVQRFLDDPPPDLTRAILPIMRDIYLHPAISRTGFAGMLLRGSLPPGDYRVTIEAEGFEKDGFDAEIRSGRKTYREVNLRRDR